MQTLNLLLASPFVSVFDGDYPDAFIPERWANESIAILREQMVMGQLVHRNFSPMIADYGDVVNTRKPGEFVPKRKTADDSVTVQALSATNVPVTLNQHLHTSFMVKDSDQSKSFQELATTYLDPALLAISQGIDKILSAQTFQFLPNRAGKLNAIDGTNAKDYLLDTRQVMNVNKAYVQDRNLVLGTVSESALLHDPTFLQAYSVGDEGSALRNAVLGRKLGFNIFMAQNTPYANPSATDKVLGAVNNAGGYNVGAKTFTVDGFAAAIPAGAWISIDGDGTPLQVVSTTGGSTPTAIVTSQGLLRAVADNAVVTVWGVGAINKSGGYAAGYAKEIVYDTFTQDPQVGNGATIGTSTYGIIAVDTVAKTVLLDRPLDAAVADNAAINLLPSGSYNLAFHTNAIAIVSRPLALPPSGTGARSGVVNHDNFSIRVTLTYNGEKQGTLVTVDTLFGVAVLDRALGAVLLG